VQRGLLLVLVHVADPFRCCPLVHAGGSLVRLGRVAERLYCGSQHFCGGSLRLGRMVPGRFHPLADGPVPDGGLVSFPEFLKPRADSVKAVSISSRRPGGGQGSLSALPGMSGRSFKIGWKLSD
jgi:hypothetical protein